MNQFIESKEASAFSVLELSSDSGTDTRNDTENDTGSDDRSDMDSDIGSDIVSNNRTDTSSNEELELTSISKSLDTESELGKDANSDTKNAYSVDKFRKDTTTILCSI